MTVEENLEVGCLIGGPGGKKLLEFVFESLPRLKEPPRNQVAGTMPGAEQQRFAAGRALTGNSALMLLNEPSEGHSTLNHAIGLYKSIAPFVGTRHDNPLRIYDLFERSADSTYNVGGCI